MTKTLEEKMLAELADAFAENIPSHAKTATEFAEELGVIRMAMVHQLNQLVTEGTWARAKPRVNGRRFLYWKLEDVE